MILDRENNMRPSATLVLTWILSAATIGGALWWYSTMDPRAAWELTETLLVRSVLGMFMMVFIASFIEFVDSVTGGWWGKKIGESTVGSTAVYCMCLLLIGFAMRLF